MSIKLLLEKVLLIVIQEHDQHIYVQSRRIRLIRGTYIPDKNRFWHHKLNQNPPFTFLQPGCLLAAQQHLLADQLAQQNFVKINLG